MSQTITLFVDGACKGNPGVGGWGAYIISDDQEDKLFGGDENTTNNRMELTAAIEGILFCPLDAKLVIWTDSNYVKQGITEWIHGWKKKQWKNVKNPDLWQKLDEASQNRQIEWHWVKGHAGHVGNEMADQLANRGVEHHTKAHEVVQHDQWIRTQALNTQTTELKKKSEPDWLLDDPFGLNQDDEELDTDLDIDEYNNNHDGNDEDEDSDDLSSSGPITITAATLHLQGPRQLILDTETTGFFYNDGDRVIEIGAIEMINRKLTGSSIHVYINPEKPVGDSVDVHGISDDFLKDKVKFADIANEVFDYLKGAEIIAHNASFDMNFLNMEFKRAGLDALSEHCQVTDSLALAKQKHPGQKNSLDALVRRYDIVQRDRTFHGALLDAEILADVYLAMTGGQVSFDMDSLSNAERAAQQERNNNSVNIDLPIILPHDNELERHNTWMEKYEQKNGKPCLFAQKNELSS